MWKFEDFAVTQILREINVVILQGVPEVLLWNYAC